MIMSMPCTGPPQRFLRPAIVGIESKGSLDYSVRQIMSPKFSISFHDEESDDGAARSNPC